MVKFYEQPASLKASRNCTSKYRKTSRSTVIKISKAIHKRLYEDAQETAQDTVESADVATANTVVELSLSRQLQDYLDNSRQPDRQHQDTFTKEVGLFVASGERTTRIQQIHRALLVVPPTSVEAERMFSASGLNMTKLRCRLSDSSIDICWTDNANPIVDVYIS